MPAHETTLRVRYGECDMQGIVFNAHYLAWFDVANTELWRDAVGSWAALTEQGLEAVVAEARLRFRAPARFDEEVVLRTTLAALGETSMTTTCDVVRDGELLVAGELRHVFLDGTTWEKVRIPDWVRSRLEPYSA
jgi:acyl-CoA thioester hydrolase